MCLQCLGPLGFPVPPAFFQYPMAYNGRTGAVTVSGMDVMRPKGFFPSEEGKAATYQISNQLDFEVELGIFLGTPVPKGKVLAAKDAAEHIFGFVLLNDWSARDIQKYEMTPLGVFHSKAFSTSISPWIVTLDTLKSSPADPPQSCKSDLESVLQLDESDHGAVSIAFHSTVFRTSPIANSSKVKDAYTDPIYRQRRSGCHPQRMQCQICPLESLPDGIIPLTLRFWTQNRRLDRHRHPLFTSESLMHRSARRHRS